ncbi:MAG: NAD(P)-dependent alcohol dehydrogenase [Burkholderiales bacterium]|jgi:NADPH:quinone reductase-like Zn-dependent oxidoreductase|nr:NAD(P)-dependent alcohol dehydrogenase [Burkholderiales bacterium]
MRALRYDRYGPPEVLEVVDLDEPVPREGELKIRVRAASLNPLDAKIRAGHLRLLPMVDRPPRGNGVDFAGEIVGTGGGVSGYFPGMRVFGSLSPFRRAGSFAEYVCAAPDRIAATPDAVTDAVAATLPIAAGTAVQAFTVDAPLERGMTALVIGAAGGVGHFAVQFAKHVGAHVTATCGADNLDFVRSLRADVVLDYTADDGIRPGARYDAVFDVAGRSSWRTVREVLAPEGIYLNTNGSASAVLATMAGTLTSRLAGRQRVVGLMLRGGAPAWQRLAALAQARSLVPHVRATIGLAGVAEAQRAIERGHGRGKVVVDPAL